jgi:hypothetical protein
MMKSRFEVNLVKIGAGLEDEFVDVKESRVGYQPS